MAEVELPPGAITLRSSGTLISYLDDGLPNPLCYRLILADAFLGQMRHPSACVAITATWYREIGRALFMPTQWLLSHVAGAFCGYAIEWPTASSSTQQV
jgi:hypothetical protein